MKAIMILITSLVCGFSAFAYDYQFQSGVRYSSGGVNYKCWSAKVFNVTAADLREYNTKINQGLNDKCMEEGHRKSCTQLNGSLSCKSANNCSRTFRSCIKLYQ